MYSSGNSVIMDDTIAETYSYPFSDISNLESSDTEIVDRNLPTSVWKSLQSCLVDVTDSEPSGMDRRGQ